MADAGAVRRGACRSIALIAVVAAVAALLSGCTHAPPGEPIVQRSMRDLGLSFAVHPASAPSDTLTAGYARPLGAAWQVVPSRRPSGASVVQFPVDPADLRAVDGHRPTTRNLFIAVWEPGLSTWVPLHTSYSARTHELNATAPHFSLFRKEATRWGDRVGAGLAHGARLVKDGATSAYHVAADAVTGLMAFQQAIEDSALAALRAAVVPEQADSRCASEAVAGSTVTTGRSQLAGCIARRSATSAPELRIENRLALPFDLQLPAGATPETHWSDVDGLAGLLSAAWDKGLGAAPVPAHGVGAADVSGLASASSWTASLHLDWPAFVIATVLAAASFVPALSEFEEVVVTQKVELLRILDEDGSKDVATMVTQITREDRAVDQPALVETAGHLSEEVACMGAAARLGESAAPDASVRSVLTKVVEAAKGCAGHLIEAATEAGATDAEQALLGVPDLTRSLVGIWQVAWAGPSLSVVPVTVTQIPSASASTTPTAPSTPDPDESLPPPTSGPSTGDVTVQLDRSYVLDGDPPAELHRPGGAAVGTLQGEADGVGLIAYGLALPAGSAGGYAPCLSLPWKSAIDGLTAFGVGHDIPDSALVPGARFCVQSTWSGLWISQLTVVSHAGTTTTFATQTWGCTAREDESALC